MAPRYGSYDQMVSSMSKGTIMDIVNAHFETVQKRKDYNDERSNDPIVQEQRKTYQRTRNAKIKLALEMLKEREKEEEEEEKAELRREENS